MINEQILIKENQSGKNIEGLRSNHAQFLTASSIIGDKVENPRGKYLGEIKDVMLDVKKGNIEYVVLKIKGFLGFTKKLFAIPFSALELNSKKKVFVVDWSREMIRKSPGFNKNHWPATNKRYARKFVNWGNFMGVNTGGVPYR